MAAFCKAAGGVLWGPPMLLFFLAVAVCFTWKSRLFQLRGWNIWLKETVGGLFSKERHTEGVSQFGAFCSVLAACIGTGNIVGVATAIDAGGPGAVFWMWLSALFSMMTAYAENYLGIRYRFRDKFGKLRGGAFHYISRGAGMPGLSKVYAVFTLASSVGMGNLAQANSVTKAVESGFGIRPVVTAAVMMLLCFLVMAGGVKRIASFSEILVPVMTAGYLILSGAILFLFRDRLLSCIGEILREAFTLKAVGGFGLYKAARYGVSRGVFSNEAGLGSSTLLHAEAHDSTPEKQGMWAMFEVFCDTVFLCTVMALVILVSGVFTPGGTLYGAELSVAAYGALGGWGKKSIALLTALFAFASLTGCSFYGEKSAEYLLNARAVKPYRLLYPLIAFAGGLTAPKTVWAMADVFNALQAVPNLFCLVVLRKEVVFPEKRSRFPRKSRLHSTADCDKIT